MFNSNVIASMADGSKGERLDKRTPEQPTRALLIFPGEEIGHSPQEFIKADDSIAVGVDGLEGGGGAGRIDPSTLEHGDVLVQLDEAILVYIDLVKYYCQHLLEGLYEFWIRSALQDGSDELILRQRFAIGRCTFVKVIPHL